MLIDNEASHAARGKLSVKARVSKYSRYLASHFDFDFDDEASPTELSLSLSKNGRQPIDLLFESEFFVDLSSDKLCRKDGATIGGKELLDEVFNQHVASLNTLHPERLILNWKLLLGSGAALVETTCKFLLTKFLGRELVADKQLRFLFKGYAPENVRKLSTDSIKLFEYLVPKNVAIVFCLLVVASFSLFHFSSWSSPYLVKIASTPVLALTHIIVLLWLLNDVVPALLRRILNWAIVFRTSHGL